VTYYSFLWIRIVLAVHFPSDRCFIAGGGVPQPPNFDDIKLGDVVASSAIGDIEGVV
jgi:hypothetical protein